MICGRDSVELMIYGLLSSFRTLANQKSIKGLTGNLNFWF